tara:strand:- start:1420 stop:2073 length:654 start_codon:yes stop_codon:yes gene_type:complete
MPFVYIINPFHCDFIKIGKWKTSLSKLQSRYQTYYGKNIEVFAYKVENYNELEIKLKNILSDYTLDPRCELLKKSYLEYYKDTFKKCCKTDYISCVKKENSLSLRIKKVPYKIIVHQKLLKLFDINYLDSLLDKVYSRQDLEHFIQYIDDIQNIAWEGRLIREQRYKGTFTLRNCTESLRKILHLFNLTIIRDKYKKQRINGRQVDITNYYFSKFNK